MKKTKNFDITEKILIGIRDAAIDNSKQLVTEAKLLLSNNHLARSYFLSIASIEETGKAYTAHEGIGRNLNNTGICNAIKIKLEDHSSKICSSFLPWIEKSDNKRESLEVAIDLITNLGFGREKSMYVDVIEEQNIISEPKNQISPRAAKDCSNIAINGVHHMQLYFENSSVRKKTSYEDKLFSIKNQTMTKMLSSRDFWEYYISELESGNTLYSKTAVTYHDKFFKQNKEFCHNNKSLAMA